MNAAKTPEITAETLPNDIAQCHAVIVQLAAVRDEQAATIRLQEREKAQLLHRVECLLRQIYGRRSEKLDPAQLLLFASEAMASLEAVPAQTEEAEEKAPPKKKGHGRKKPACTLPHFPIEHPVAEADKVCTQCGGAKRRIGEKVTEQLDFAPASMFVIDHIQPVYACPHCQEGVVVAPKPAQPIEKGLPGPGLIAQVVVSKYCDHLPLYRQERIFERHGAAISRQTMCDWVLAAARLLEPVVAAMKTRVLESKVMHTDDTPVTVCEPGKKGTHQGRFWIYLGDANNPYTVYDYTPNRNRDGPAVFLEHFHGTPQAPRYLQADAYGGYDGIYTGAQGNPDRVLIEVACWAHTRRYFHNARSSDPVRAHYVLGCVRQLYAIEHDAKDFSADARRTLRQEKAKPILDKMKEWIDAEQSHVLPKSPIGEAVQYTLNQWKALNRYLEDGDLDIDNNPAENRLRGIGIGRKNYLFMGSDRGGRAAAILYSMIQSAKDHGLDPFLYLRDLFLRIPTHPNKELHQLLPDHWKIEILPTLTPPPRL